MITLKNVTVKYPHADEPALNAIDLTIDRGEFVGVIGLSGAGKSTLIRCMKGFITPTSGEIYVMDERMSTTTSQQKKYIHRSMAMIFQQFNLIPRLTVLQNVMIGRFAYHSRLTSMLGLFTQQEKEMALQALQKVGLEAFTHQRVDRLSGGQQQRVAIARALVQEPQILLGDEPVASLDPVTSVQIFDLLTSIHRSFSINFVINIHDVEMAKNYCDRLIGLREGRVVFDGRPHQLDRSTLDHIYVA